mmetsp:Transcript_15982/g.28697  ORF Transcript_15982/g.28697 Transcript_15982/m.28697 type:complete len:318 (+) Transcript_15982:401-1354(+)
MQLKRRGISAKIRRHIHPYFVRRAIENDVHLFVLWVVPPPRLFFSFSLLPLDLALRERIHHNSQHPQDLARPGVEEAHLPFNILGRRQSPQNRVVPDPNIRLEQFVRPLNYFFRGRQSLRLPQQCPFEFPLAAVFGFDGQPASKKVGGSGPVDAVEPVAGVVRVPIQILGSQQVIAGVEERHSLAEGHECMAEQHHARATLGRLGLVCLFRDDVEDGHVVVAAQEGHVFLGLDSIGERLVMDPQIPTLGTHPEKRFEFEVAEVASKATADPVRKHEQLPKRCGVVALLLPDSGSIVGGKSEPRDDALEVGRCEGTAT